ncbi:MAG: MAPEG family protein [Pseudomonadota bacterium]
MTNATFLTPVLALIVWTAVMWFWLYATRIPAMQAARIHPDKARHPSGEWKTKLPPRVLSVADNYNHLHEQPTVFYALMFYIVLTTGGDRLSLIIASVYVGLRVVHSLVQIFSSNVVMRFSMFALCSLTLFALLGKTLIAAL